MHSGRLACAPRVSLRALPLALAAASALTCPPSTFAAECRDVRTGHSFTIPSVRYTSAGEPDSTAAAFGGLCVGAVRSTYALPVSDGNGGAIVVWIESSGSDCDLRVQRLVSGGLPADGWPEGGRQLCAAPGTQTQPAVAPAGDGGAWFAWKDFREPHQSAIYLARLDATGSPVAAFPEGGAWVSPEGRTLRVRLEVPNADGSLKGGLFAEGEFLAEGEVRRPALPASAVTALGRDAEVFVAEAGVARRKKITVGPDQGGWRPIDGLSKGAEVVAQGRDQLADGTRLQQAKGK